MTVKFLVSLTFNLNNHAHILRWAFFSNCILQDLQPDFSVGFINTTIYLFRPMVPSNSALMYISNVGMNFNKMKMRIKWRNKAKNTTPSESVHTIKMRSSPSLPLLICGGVWDLRKSHYGSNSSDRMSWMCNDMINTVITFFVYSDFP
jgi:hypothetical protein